MRDENEPFASDVFSSDRTQETTRRRSDTDARRETTDRTPVEPSVAHETSEEPQEIPESIAHFEIQEMLGEGGFARVFRARDTKLDRDVALKVPHFREQNQADLGAIYLHEARAMARLDHPHIIKVFEANRTDEVPCYLVTQLIDGEHLGDWIESTDPGWEALARIFQRLAEALAFAHDHGIIHRDVKPSNIFIRRDGVPFIGDFGLAVRDQIDGGPGAGTPSYRSPEQARGEGHRVDGRSDLFSLGIVLYRALAGRKPFLGVDPSLRHDILYTEPPHPRELNPEVPTELARICTRLLSKAACDRYQSGDELAADLADFVAETNLESIEDRDAAIEQVIPRGLRAFDADDAEHFLHLLPGPRDRAGIPEAVRYWLSKLDPSDPRDAIPVGLIYGPSGCGKTSLVRAGVIPRLPTTTQAIYLQATPDTTETELSEALAAHSHAAIEGQELADQIKTLRQARTRTVIFIDQFEQWLFSHPNVEHEPLTQALRQCDGEHVQCVLLVRDDFWLSVSRFMQALEHPIAENHNATLIDLFDLRHAREVLMMFGAAFGRLPASKTRLTKEQNRFLDQAVQSIASNGRVVSVHLSLLAQILKERDWEAASGLFRDGGTGIGVRFLEETFDAQNAPQRVRRLVVPCEKVLRALLPTAGSNIKGGIQSESELKAALGEHAVRLRDTLAFLDGELHLITPTEDTGSGSGESGYQLSHDFLIAPIRQWVSLRNRATNAGRARLRLEELSALYKLRPITQTLPTLGEYLSIRRNVPSSSLNSIENKMMEAARRLHRRRVLVSAAVVGLLAVVGWWTFAMVRKSIDERRRKDELATLLAAPLDQTFRLSAEAREDALIREDARRAFEDSTDEPQRLRAAAINFDVEDRAATLLVEHALVGPVNEAVAIAQEAFSSMDPEIQSAATAAWEKQSTSPGERVRAACLLANDEQLRQRFEEPLQIKQLIDVLSAESPVHSELWARGFQELTDQLLPRLKKRLLDPHREQASLTAVNLTLEFVPDDTELIVELIRNAKPDEFQVLVQRLSAMPEGLDLLRSRWETSLETPAFGDPASPWGSPWWVIGDRQRLKGPFRELSLSTQEKNDFDAVVRSHAVLMHRLPESQLQPMIERAQAAGYRIADASPYAESGERCFFALWVRDGAPGVFEWDLSAEALRERNQELRESGWLPCNVDGYIQDGEIRYLSNWISLGESSSIVEADMYVEVNEKEHEERGWGRMMKRGMYVPRASVEVHLDAPGGEGDWISSVRWEPVLKVNVSDDWEISVTEPSRAEPLLSLGQEPFSNVSSSEESDFTSGIWWSGLGLQSSEARYQIRAEHRQAAVERLDQGFYPVSISAGLFSNSDQPQFQSAWWRAPVAIQKITQSRELMRLAIALLYLGEDRYVIECLESTHGNEVRGAVIAGLRDFSASPDWLVDQIVSEDIEPLRLKSCLMALSLISPAAAPKQRERLMEFLPQYGLTETDSGIRSAIASLDTKWELDYELPAPPEEGYEWFSVAGDRMVVIRPPETIWVGSTEGEPGRSEGKEQRRQIRIGHAYAVSTREVTIEQLLRLLPDHEYPGEYASTTDRPAINATWYDAVKYCRLLSELEGIPESEMCYPSVENIGPGMKVPADAVLRKGYRLPTEAEWEYAARGGGDEGRWFGFDPERLADHAWTNETSGNRTWPGGRLLPNDYGLFDMLGNAMEFCHGPKDWLSDLEGSGPHDDPGARAFVVFDDGPKLPARGGAMLYQPGDARATQRNWAVATHKAAYSGFRVVRTVD